MTLDPKKIAKKIKIPLSKWSGNCAVIADALVRHNIVIGKTRYGLYSGFIHPKSSFASRPVTHHGWIEKPNKEIVDPTRWVFENVEPYIYIGPNSGEYDFGGNQFRAAIRQPCPAYDPTQRLLDYSDLSGETQQVIATLVGDQLHPEQFSVTQAGWLANCLPQEFGSCVKEFYEWLKKNGVAGFIPYDNRIEILGAD